MKMAAVTMVYNEPDFLPIWLRYYVAQVGPTHCYVIDHGSDDGSTRDLPGVNVIRIPRSPIHEEKRCRFVSNFASSLLEWYDWVIHTDADEIVVADPALHHSLADFAATCEHEVITTIGCNVVHPTDEAPIDLTLEIMSQRHWVHFLASMCKPVLTRRPIRWGAGFHRADAEPRFDDLFLFHLRWFDRDIGARRLVRSRNQAWSDPETNWWHRVSDTRGAELFAATADRPRDAAVKLHATAPAVLRCLANSFGPGAGEPGASVFHHLNYQASALWPVPPRFWNVF